MNRETVRAAIAAAAKFQQTQRSVRLIAPYVQSDLVSSPPKISKEDVRGAGYSLPWKDRRSATYLFALGNELEARTRTSPSTAGATRERVRVVLKELRVLYRRGAAVRKHSFAALVDKFTQWKAYSAVVGLAKLMREESVPPTRATLLRLILASSHVAPECTRGHWEEAQRVFGVALDTGVARNILRAHAQLRDPEGAVAFFRECRAAGLSPDLSMYEGLLQAHRTLAPALRAWKRLRLAGLRPTGYTLSLVVRAAFLEVRERGREEPGVQRPGREGVAECPLGTGDAAPPQNSGASSQSTCCGGGGGGSPQLEPPASSPSGCCGGESPQADSSQSIGCGELSRPEHGSATSGAGPVSSQSTGCGESSQPDSGAATPQVSPPQPEHGAAARHPLRTGAAPPDPPVSCTRPRNESPQPEHTEAVAPPPTTPADTAESSTLDSSALPPQSSACTGYLPGKPGPDARLRAGGGRTADQSAALLDEGLRYAWADAEACGAVPTAIAWKTLLRVHEWRGNHLAAAAALLQWRERRTGPPVDSEAAAIVISSCAVAAESGAGDPTRLAYDLADAFLASGKPVCVHFFAALYACMDATADADKVRSVADVMTARKVPPTKQIEAIHRKLTGVPFFTARDGPTP